MPLTVRQQKDLKLFTKGLITEVNEGFGRHNQSDALINIQKAISNISEDEFKQEMKDQPEAIREPLTNLRNLFHVWLRFKSLVKI